MTFSGGGKQKILPSNAAIEKTLQVKASPQKYDKTAEFGGSQAKQLTPLQKLQPNLLVRKEKSVFTKKDTSLNVGQSSPTKKKERAETIDHPQAKPTRVALAEKQSLDNRKGSLPVDVSKGQIKDPMSMKERRHTTVVAAVGSNMQPSSSGLSPNKLRRVMPPSEEAKAQGDNIISRFKKNQANVLNETNRPLFLQGIDDGCSEVDVLMSPSSRYGSAATGQNMTPINRRKIQIQQQNATNNNLTPGSLVKL